VVDSDDMSKSWLVNRIIGNRVVPDDHDEEEGGQHVERGGPRTKWGSRGISVSADEGVHEHEGHLANPDQFEDDIDEQETGIVQPPKSPHQDVVDSAAEWRDSR